MNPSSNLNLLSHPDGGRKHYKNKEEVKEEWKSYISYRAEAQSKLAQLQKDLNNLRTKQFSLPFDQNLKDQIQEKEYQLRVRNKDIEIIDLQMKHFQMVILSFSIDQSNHISSSIGSFSEQAR